MFSDWVSFLAYPNLFGIKDFVVVVVVDNTHKRKKKIRDRVSRQLGLSLKLSPDYMS
jgi:hypothetical protein